MSFRVDTAAPEIRVLEPADNQYTNLSAIRVSGGVIDASPVTVKVEGIDAPVTG